jgi:hypothetical protein
VHSSSPGRPVRDSLSIFDSQEPGVIKWPNIIICSNHIGFEQTSKRECQMQMLADSNSQYGAMV